MSKAWVHSEVLTSVFGMLFCPNFSFWIWFSFLCVQWLWGTSHRPSVQDSLGKTQTPHSLPPCENESELGHSKTTEQWWSLQCLWRWCKAPRSLLQIFKRCRIQGCVCQQDFQKDKISLASPLQKAARSVTQDFLKLVLYLVHKSPGGWKVRSTHTGTVSTAVCCGPVRNCRKPTEEDAKKTTNPNQTKNEKGKGKEGRSCFSQSLAALASRVKSQKRHVV